MAPALGMALEHACGQGFAQATEFLRSDGVLKAGQGRLRCQIPPRNRIAAQQPLVDRVGGQAGRVVGVRIAAGDGKPARRQQFFQRRADLARLPRVAQTGSQARNQSIAAAFSRMAPPSKLPSRWSNCSTVGWGGYRETTNTVSC